MQERTQHKYQKILFIVTIVLLFLAVSLGIIFLSQNFWHLLLDENSREAVKVIVSIVSTIATIAGGVIVFLNFKIAQTNASLSEQNLSLSQTRLIEEKEQIATENRLARSRLVSERFAKATEQLGNNKNIAIRLGGIYSLEQIAKESFRYHWITIELLTAFLREQPPLDNEATEQEASSPEEIKLIFRADLQAALTVIGRRNFSLDTEDSKLNLIGAQLVGASFIEGSFSEAKMFGANLRKAHLRQAKFLGTMLYKANLREAIVHETNFWKADLRNANFTNSDCRNADFREANIQSVDFRGAKNLNIESIKSAKNWQEAIYNEDFKDSLENSI